MTSPKSFLPQRYPTTPVAGSPFETAKADKFIVCIPTFALHRPFGWVSSSPFHGGAKIYPPVLDVLFAGEQKNWPEKSNVGSLRGLRPGEWREARMTIKHYLVAALSLAVAVVASAVLVVPKLGSASTNQAYSLVESQPLDRQVFDQQLDAMRTMHQKMLTARSTETRHALLLDSVPIMRAGVAMMLQMKVALPATPTGELLSSVISQVEAEHVKDFLALMELLVEMKNDQAAALNHHRLLIRESAPVTTLLKASVPTGAAPTTKT